MATIKPKRSHCYSSISFRIVFLGKIKLQNIFGSVWIEFIFAETENWNWKHCSKIIFKCMNSIVGPIFNEKVAEKWNLWVREQCTLTWSNNAAGKKKKNQKTQPRIQRKTLNPNGHHISLVWFYIYYYCCL